MAAGGRFFGLLGKIGIGLAITGGIAQSALYNVDGGHRAVIFDRFRGVQQKVSGEGTHFIIPMVQYPIIYDCRSKPRNVPVITGSKDLQNVHITLRILFRPKVEFLPQIYSNLGVDYDEKVLPSITTEVLKAVVTHLNFGREFSEAVEMKAVAQQDAERARWNVEKAEQQKRAAIIAAEGDSKAAELLAKAFQDSGEGLIELRKLEAAEEISNQLAQNRGVTWMPTKQGILLNVQPGGPSGPVMPPERS